MMRLALIFLLLVSTACSDEEAEELRSRAAGLVEDASLPRGLSAESYEELKKEISSLFEEVQADDFEAWKTRATSLNTYMSVRIWKWYSSISEINCNEGRHAALELVRGIRATPDIEAHELEALEEIEKELEKEKAGVRKDMFWRVLFHSLRPRYGDEGALLIMVAISAAQVAGRL